MPKLRPETELARATSLSKALISNRLSQTKTAQQEGVTPQAINQRLNRTPVKKTLQEIIDRNLKKAGITDTKVYRRLDDQLNAKKGQNKPDHIARDKAIDKCLALMGHIKQANGNGKGGISAIIININNKSGLFTEKEADALSHIGS